MALRFGIRRRWLRISLRTFLLLVLAICAGLAYTSNRARKQEEMVRRMVHEGRGGVQYHHEVDANGNRIPGAAPPGPAWLRRLVGEHVFSRLRSIGTENATEDDLRLISQFPSIEWLGLDEWVRDDGMEHIARLRNLKELQLRSLYLTDRGLEHVAGLRKLETLIIGNARITDSGLKHLAGLSNLKELHLDKTQITGEGINWLRKRLPNVKIQPEGFPYATEEREIVEQLIENGARFEADKDGYVSNTMFYGPEAGDEDLLPLGSLARLKKLELIETWVTQAGVDRLRQSHPELTVFPEFRQPLSEEAEAVAALRGIGARLSFDKQGHVTGLESFNKNISAESLGPVAELRQLKRITLTVPYLGLAECRVIGDVESLESLWAPEADLNDEDIEQLSRLVNLKRLWVGAACISDAGLEHLVRLPLETLELPRAAISGPGLAHLTHLSKLHVYFVPPAGLTDEGLAHVAKLTSLRSLTLDFTQITDDGLQHLDKLVELEKLSLEGSDITDTGLLRLGKVLPKLKSLHLEDTQVTSDGVQQFQRLHPGCKVRH